jgi:hypothetical protein
MTNNFAQTNDAFSFVEAGIRLIQPVYVRLQALQSGSIVLWEAVPQNFSDQVGTIDVYDLALMVSSNAQSINLSRDGVGNLWVAINYTFTQGDYISSLMWVSTETGDETPVIPDSIVFPTSYPQEVISFLQSGRKIPVENEEIKEIASNSKTQNMVETVKNVLNYVNQTQGYDRAAVELLMSGNLNTTDILDVFEEPVKVMETNSSMCLERSLYAATILRAASVPARTLTDIRLRTWVQVWLNEYGWVDAEAECNPQRSKARVLFPRPLSVYTPWAIENTSDAAFPFKWLPEVQMRVANLTFSNVKAFNIDEYGTILTQPVDKGLFDSDPDVLSFPVLFSEPDMVYAAVIRDGANLNFSLVKGKETVSTILTLNGTNIVSIGDKTFSFEPIRQDEFVVLQNFVVQEAWRFDFRIFLIPIIGVPVILISWLYLKRKRKPLTEVRFGKLIKLC